MSSVALAPVERDCDLASFERLHALAQGCALVRRRPDAAGTASCHERQVFRLDLQSIAREHGRQEAELISHYYMALEISQTTDGMLIALPVERWLELATLPLSVYTSQLCDIAKGIDLSVYRKSERGPKKPKPKKKHQKKKVHVSVAKILAQRQHNRAC